MSEERNLRFKKLDPNAPELIHIEKILAGCIGVEGYDWEDLVWMTDPSFWKMIEERRQRAQTMSQEEVDEVETLEILGDPELMTALRQSIKDAEAGKGIPWDEAKRELGLFDPDEDDGQL